MIDILIGFTRVSGGSKGMTYVSVTIYRSLMVMFGCFQVRFASSSRFQQRFDTPDMQYQLYVTYGNVVDRPIVSSH
jgi:hypothetical protein